MSLIITRPGYFIVDEDYDGNDIESILIESIGNPLPLSADWSVSTWPIGNDLYWCDDEIDGSYSLVKRMESEWEEIEVLDSINPNDYATHIEIKSKMESIVSAFK